MRRRRTMIATPASQSLKSTSIAASASSASPLNRPQPTEHDKLVKQAEVWVAQTFYGTLLKQMHDSPFKSELFNGGRGGEAFGALYDQHLCERMARGVGSKLVNSIVKRIEAKAAYTKQKTAN